jgi:hypothetical protein
LIPFRLAKHIGGRPEGLEGRPPLEREKMKNENSLEAEQPHAFSLEEEQPHSIPLEPVEPVTGRRAAKRKTPARPKTVTAQEKRKGK